MYGLFFSCLDTRASVNLMSVQRLIRTRDGSKISDNMKHYWRTRVYLFWGTRTRTFSNYRLLGQPGFIDGDILSLLGQTQRTCNSSIFRSFAQFPQDNSMTFGTCMHTQWVSGAERNLQFGKYQSFIMGCRQPCSIIFLGGIGTISKQSSSPRKASCPLLENTQKYRPEGSRLSEVTPAWGQSRASITEILSFQMQNKIHCWKVQEATRQLIRVPFIQRRTRKKRNGCSQKLGEVRKKPVCPLSLVIKGKKNTCNRGI